MVEQNHLGSVRRLESQLDIGQNSTGVAMSDQEWPSLPGRVLTKGMAVDQTHALIDGIHVERGPRQVEK